MKIIVLIIASNGEHYDKMITIWEKYMNSHTNIQSFFIMNKEDIKEDVILIDNIIYVKSKENLIPGILIKTIKSINFCINNLDFDFIFRTNLSSFIILDKLYEFVKNNNIDYGGVIGVTDNFIKFASGSGFLISKETCKYLIENENDLLYNLIDDVAIGQLLTKKYKITPIIRINNVPHQGGFDYDYLKNNPCFHFRCKNYYNNHEDTILFMKNLFNLIYS
jgi:hypothetical protein